MKVLIPILVSSLLVMSAIGQEPNYVHYTLENGLPAREIYQIFQTSDNHIWIASDLGISRFDGRHFKNYPLRDGLGNEGFLLIHQDEQNVLRFISVKSNIYEYNRLTDALELVEIATSDRQVLNKKETCSFIVDDDGHFELGFTRRGGRASVLNDGSVQFDDQSNHTTAVLRSYGDDLLYFNTKSTDQKIEYDGLITLSQEVTSVHINALKLDSVHTVFTIGRSLYLFYEGSLIKTLNYANTIIGLSIDRSGTLWVGQLEYGVIGYSFRDSELVESYHFLKGQSVTSVIEDHEGGHWFSTYQQGIYYAPEITTIFYNQSRGTSGVSCTAIEGNASDEVLVGYVNGSISIFKDDRIQATQKLRRDDGLPTGLSVKNIRYQKKSNTYLIANGNTFRLHEGIVSQGLKVNQELKVYPYSNDILIDTDDGLWLGGYSLYHVDAAGALDVQPAEAEITQLSFDLDSNVLALVDGNLSSIIDGRLTPIETSRSSEFELVKLIKGGELAMVKASGEITITRPTETLTFKQSEEQSSRLTFDVTRGDRDDILISSSSNTERISLDDPLDRRFVIGRNLGILHQSHRVAYMQNNQLWIGTSGGVYRVDNAMMEASTLPTPMLLDLMTPDSTYRLSDRQSVQLTAGESDLQISLKAITFKYADSHHFEYRLGPSQTEFRAQDGHMLSFNSIEAGTHELELRMATESGHRSESVTLQIVLPQVFWRTPWFVTMLFCLLCVLVYFISAIITRRTRKRELEKFKNKELITSLKLRSLQSQFNPHFTFNAINSIQHHISKENTEQAKAYLGMFSDIMRSVLRNSGQENIKLAEELTMLDTYLKLEQLRFGEKLAYTFEVNERVDVDFEEIPPLILQPIVENAINHGLFNKPGRGHIRVEIDSIDDVLTCSVTDDGIGRAKSLVIQKRKKVKSIGRGLQLVAERLRLLNKTESEVLVITDLYDDDGKALGTRVTIKIEQHD